jgi:VanZ family protein
LIQFFEKHKYPLVYIPLIVYWLILLAATSFPSEKVPTLGVGDKFKHFAAYFILAFLLNLALLVQNKYKTLKEKAAPAALFISIIYGILDELHQIFIPGRSCEFLDWVADASGAILGVVTLYLIRKYYDESYSS